MVIPAEFRVVELTTIRAAQNGDQADARASVALKLHQGLAFRAGYKVGRNDSALIDHSIAGAPSVNILAVLTANIEKGLEVPAIAVLAFHTLGSRGKTGDGARVSKAERHENKIQDHDNEKGFHGGRFYQKRIFL